MEQSWALVAVSGSLGVCSILGAPEAFLGDVVHILRLNIDDIKVEHLDELVAARGRESEALEFKETLPFQPQKGLPQRADRWIEQGGGNGIGEYARDQILAEMVAFANASGGTLVIGVQESKEEPREAVGLLALPKCEALAQRLLAAAEDRVEPRLLSLSARGLPIDETGWGYVILRVGRSRAGPHRLNGRLREFYMRRGERAAKMDVREIKSLTLELARSGDRVQEVFDDRRRAARERFNELPRRKSEAESPPLLLRASAFPTLAMEIDGLTTKPELWWQGGGFNLQFEKGDLYECSHPARCFQHPPRIQLRSLVGEADRFTRVLRDDGLSEATLSIAPRPTQSSSAEGRVFVSWIVGLLVGTLAQVEHLRRRVGWDTVEFGLEVELWCSDAVHLLWQDMGLALRVGYDPRLAVPLRFPLYSVRQFATFDDLLNQFLQDLHNAWGDGRIERATVDWGALVAR